MTPAVGLLCASDLAHGVVEGQAEDLDMEVNGIASEFQPDLLAFHPEKSGGVRREDIKVGAVGDHKVAPRSRGQGAGLLHRVGGHATAPVQV